MKAGDDCLVHDGDALLHIGLLTAAEQPWCAFIQWLHCEYWDEKKIVKVHWALFVFCIYFHGLEVTFLYCNFYKITFYRYLNLSAEGLSLVFSCFTIIKLNCEVPNSDCKTSLTHSEAFPSVACNKRLVNATFLSILQQVGVRLIRMSQVGQSLLHPAAHTHISNCHHVILDINCCPTTGKSVINTSLAM